LVEEATCRKFRQVQIKGSRNVEIVLELQSGNERAGYGKHVLENLSNRLKEQYRDGFAVAKLKNFRQLYLIYPNRLDSIRYLPGGELAQQDEKCYLSGSLVGRVKRNPTSVKTLL
jgi:hypothetical protein